MAASNGGLGIFITSDQKVIFRRSSANSNNGTGIYVGAPEVTMEDVVVNNNGFYGIHAEVTNRLDVRFTARFNVFLVLFSDVRRECVSTSFRVWRRIVFVRGRKNWNREFAFPRQQKGRCEVFGDFR